MTSLSKLFLAFALAFALAPFASAEEKQNQIDNKIDFSNITFEIGTYNSSDKLSKRDVPDECIFEGRIGGYITYIKLDAEEGTACVAYDNDDGSICDDKKRWGPDEVGDIMLAMDTIVTMDGWDAESQAGEWKGLFLLGTTAFSNRDTLYFVEGFIHIDVQPDTIY